LLFRRHRLLAPDLLMAACANILWKKVRRKELTQDVAMIAARLLAGAKLEIEPMRGLLEPGARLAITLDHPAYDCCYLALAEARGCDFVTADGALARKLRTAGVPLNVAVVRDIGPA